MTRFGEQMIEMWQRAGTRLLPFADAASEDLPLARLLRLSLFQISVGLCTALAVGTLNRVMIVELGVMAGVVSTMVALPLIVAPLRAFAGHRSDVYRSPLGWRRVPFIWFGSLASFGGLAIMPFALLLLSGDGDAPAWVGGVAAALAFLLMGAGMQITQTAGLALATDLAPIEKRPRVVALMYVMLLLGVLGSSFAFSLLLADFSPMRLIQVVQGAALAVMVLNVVAMWKQEPRNPTLARSLPEDPDFRSAWRAFVANPGAVRFLVVVGLGTAGFNMQDIVLEAYGGEILKMSVSETTMLTALTAAGALAAFSLSAFLLGRGRDPYRLAAVGLVCGLPAFAAVIFAAPFEGPRLFEAGVVLVGFGGGLFAVGTLTAAMAIEDKEKRGLALGAWGAVQAGCAGLSMAAGGLLRDLFAQFGAAGRLGPTLGDPAAAYGVVYLVELVLLFAAIAALGPLASYSFRPNRDEPVGLSEMPG
jgi:BCD family chlorophyll transporter-like MFS transporter